MNTQKRFVSILLILLGMVVIVGVAYFYIQNNKRDTFVNQEDTFVSKMETQTNDKSDTKVNFLKTYKDEKNGFEIQYPYFFYLEGNPTIDSGNISLGNRDCDQTGELCLTNIQGISITISNNQDNQTIDTYYQKRKTDLSITNLKRITIEHQPTLFNKDGTSQKGIEAVRYDFPGGAGQTGGYAYVIIEKGKVFSIETLLLGNSYGSSYDGLLDRMMHTLTFTK